jgi:hypothetical protein
MPCPVRLNPGGRDRSHALSHEHPSPHATPWTAHENA